MPTHSFAVVNNYILFVELASLVIISDKGELSRLYCALNVASFNLVSYFIVVLKLSTKLMIEAQISDMICRSLKECPVMLGN